MYTGEGKRRQMIGIGHVVKMGRRQVGMGVSEKKKTFKASNPKEGPGWCLLVLSFSWRTSNSGNDHKKLLTRSHLLLIHSSSAEVKEESLFPRWDTKNGGRNSLLLPTWFALTVPSPLFNRPEKRFFLRAGSS